MALLRSSLGSSGLGAGLCMGASPSRDMAMVLVLGQ